MRPSALLWLAIVAQIKTSNAFLPASWKIAGTAAGRMKHDVQTPTLMADGRTYASSIMLLYSQPEAAPSSATSSAASAPKEEEEKDLTPETIAEMIEVSFLQGCMQLAQGYVDVLKLFIVAVKTGYEKKIPLDELNQLVQDCPVNSAGRDLMKEELELRREWMAVVYGMMEALNNNEMGDQETTSDTTTTTGSSNDSSQTRVAQVVDSMLQLQRYLQEEEEQSGGEQDSIVALTNLTVEQALQKLPNLSQVIDELESSPMEKAFLTNDIRVALLTFKVIEEEKICFEDRKGRSLGTSSEIPRPPIKGT
jgi:hypothetical protein